MRSASLKLLLVVTLLSIFSGCAKDPIVTYQGCPQLDIYEIPDKILVKGNYLGKTNIYSNFSNPKLLGDTDIISNIADTNTSMINGVLMPVEMLMDIIDYTTELRTGAEKYNAQILDKNVTK